MEFTFFIMYKCIFSLGKFLSCGVPIKILLCSLVIIQALNERSHPSKEHGNSFIHLCLMHEQYNFFSCSVSTNYWISYTRYVGLNKSKLLDSYPATNAQLNMNDTKVSHNL